MTRNLTEFLAGVDLRTAEFSAVCPGLEVFSRARDKVRECVRAMAFQPRSGDDHVVFDELEAELQSFPGEDSDWALAWIDLHYCSNFGGHHWSRLIQRDPRNIRFAIQAAWYVRSASGHNGNAALAELIATWSCEPDALQYLTDQSTVPMRQWWSDELIPLVRSNGPKQDRRSGGDRNVS